MKFLSGALPTFRGGRGLDGCVTAHWIGNCSVLWVANFLNTSSTEKCTMGIHTVVQMQTILLSRRSWGIEYIEVLRIFWEGWTFNFASCFLSSGVVWTEVVFLFSFGFLFLLFKTKSVVYTTFSLWKGQDVGQIHHELICIFYHFFQLYNKCQLIVHEMTYSSTQFTTGIGKSSFIFSTWH